MVFALYMEGSKESRVSFHWEQYISETLPNVRYPTPKLLVFSESVSLHFLTSSLLVTGCNLNSYVKASLFLESWPKTSKPQLPYFSASHIQ